MIVGFARRLRGNRRGQAEHVLEGMIQPHARGGGAEKIIILGEDTPDLAAVGFRPAAVGARHAEAFKADALGEQHAEDVVVGSNEQLGGIGKRLVFRKPARVRVAVRADDRFVRDRLVKGACDLAGLRICRKQPVWRQQCHFNPPNRRGPLLVFSNFPKGLSIGVV